MVSAITLRNQFMNALNENSDKLRFKYFTGSVSPDSYNDEQKLTQSGSDLWTSGCIQPIKTVQGSNDAVLLEQGKIKTTDKKVFIPGTIITTGIIKIGVGSPIQNENSIVPDGDIPWNVNGSIVYKILYMRELPTGSLSGE